jgi:hypothetical protein
MAKPTEKTGWVATGNIATPSALKKASGYIAAEQPPHTFVNKHLVIDSQWQDYIDNIGVTESITMGAGTDIKGLGLKRIKFAKLTTRSVGVAPIYVSSISFGSADIIKYYQSNASGEDVTFEVSDLVNVGDSIYGMGLQTAQSAVTLAMSLNSFELAFGDISSVQLKTGFTGVGTGQTVNDFADRLVTFGTPYVRTAQNQQLFLVVGSGASGNKFRCPYLIVGRE